MTLHQYSYAEYLAHEEASGVKHEYLAGDIYAMAGGTPDHAALAVAISTALVNALGDRNCRVFSSDLRVRVLATGLATYPDVTVVCGPAELDPASQVTVVNPLLIVEVLSDGTEEYDRGEKQEHYRQIPSLREYILVSHRRPSILVLRKSVTGEWSRIEVGPGQRLRIEALECDLDVDMVYRIGLARS